MGEGDPRGQHQAGVISTRRYFILPIGERRSLDDRLGSKVSLWRSGDHFRAGAISGPFRSLFACRKGANNGSRAYSTISSQRESIFLRWSFGQPGLPQSFFVSRDAFGVPRAQHVFEIGNT
jgi:hypothetical protein